MATSLPARGPDLGEAQPYYAETRRVYGSWFVEGYDLVTAPLRHLRGRIARLAGIGPGMRVIDLATGTGAQARAFAARGASVVGLDLSPRMLAIARRRTPRAAIRYVEADATSVPERDASFDVASISFALHEMPASIRERVIRELVRVTRPDGTIVVVDFARPRSRVWRFLVEHAMAPFERDAYRDFVRSDLNGLLERAGVSAVTEHRAVLDTVRILLCRRAFGHDGIPPRGADPRETRDSLA